ncbi:peroxisomal ATPase PEX1 [Anabrus simplex]|uniref:peroxisomal ATPase PEX1 n=1 Tax=Anabrus simplex TaxID=316456 RepID=UPI0035A3139F
MPYGMKKEPFTVKYISVNNCSLCFSAHCLKRFDELRSYTTVVKVLYGFNKFAYFSWSLQPMNLEDSSVGVSATYARVLGLQNEETVFLSLHRVEPVSKIVVSPVTYDDWDILEMNSGVLQSSMLNQIQVVWPGQKFVAWVSKSVHVVLHVESLEPEYEVGRLGVLSDVVIALPGEKTRGNDNQAIAEALSHNSENTDLSSSTIANKRTPALNSSESVNNTDFIPSVSTNGTKSSMDGSYNNFSLWGQLKVMSSLFFGKNETTIAEQEEQTSQVVEEKIFSRPSKCVLYRVYLLNLPRSRTNNVQFQPYSVFIHRENLLSQKYSSDVCYKLTYIPFSPKLEEHSSVHKIADKNRETKVPVVLSVFVRVYVIEDTISSWYDSSVIETHRKHKCIFVSKPVQKCLNLIPGARVTLEPMTHCENSEFAIELHITPVGIWEESPENLESLVRRSIVKQSQALPVLISSGGLFPLYIDPSQDQYVLVNLVPDTQQYVVLDSEKAMNCKITVNPGSQLDSTKVEPNDSLQYDNMYFSWAEDIISEGLTSLEISLGIQPGDLKMPPSWSSLSVVNTLIVGKCGSGRSTLAKLLSHRVNQPLRFVHVVEVQCRHLKGKKADTLHKLLSSSLVECVYYQPSVLFLDDLEELAGVALQEQEGSQESAYYTRVAEMISLLLEEYQARNYIAVIATAPAMLALNPALASSRGHHTFRTVLQMPELTKMDRLNILKNLVTERDVLMDKSADLESIAHKCEGYMVQDLVDLYDKAMFEAWKRAVSEEKTSLTVLENKDFEHALECMTPLSLQGVELFHDSTRSWQDVGGLEKVKETLIELLMWPSQYPELYAQSPLRQQSGILLYGAPGTGKTLLAGAVAHECKLNFISVKGPELLSKYIGASEESVRNIFQKAQSAKPSILFFDEFESLAPRRGHDSTGVTDRVVNQLLTQLDGVESLVGVWVIAASNRPDLLDPALLRPGRLDRCIECPLPDREDRLAILNALSRKLHLCNDVDLAEIARLSEGFTGADLQAVLYTAQLMAMENKVVTEDGMEMRPTSDINQQLLMSALKDTRPSLTRQERLKYETINKKFSNSRGGRGAVEEFSILPQRATLA